MSIIKADTVITGKMNKINTIPMEEYLNNTIASFTVTEWAELSEDEKASYKFALVYDPDVSVNVDTEEVPTEEETK